MVPFCIPVFAAALLPQSPSPPFEFGGSVRERYERIVPARFGAGPQDDDGYFLHRALLHGSYGDGTDVKVFAELQAAFVSDRTGGPRPTDEDRCDLHQAYVDVRARLDGGAAVTTRVGRAEMSYGSQRLVSVREGPNVRLAFDGARVMLRDGGWTFDAFAVRPVEVDAGEFDDCPLEQTLFGAYATLPVLPAGGVDLYCLVLDREAAEFVQGVGEERRWSLGTRVFGKPAPWDHDFEFVWQTGTWANGGIAAWTVASDVGCTLPIPTTPRLGIKIDVASGDRDAGTDSLQTFHALFPRGSYFGEPALIGPANLFDVHPSIALGVLDDVRLAVDGDWFWRQSLADGVYGSALTPLRPGSTSSRRFVGSQVQVTCEWTVRPNWTATIAWARFFAGPWLADTGSADDVDYLGIWTTLRF